MSNINAIPPQLQMIQQYQLINGSLINIRQTLERTDLSAEDRNQLQVQERDLQQRLQFFQQIISQLPPMYPNQQQQQQIALAQAAQQQQQHQIHQLQQPPAQQQPQANVSQPPSSGQAPTPAMAAGTDASSSARPTPANAAGGDASSSRSGGAAPANPLDLQSQTIVSRRQLQQLAPTERLEPEVEEILMEAADEFIESVTQFACQLARHRKSDTLQVKDLQLHLERNWNVRIPGFASDDIKGLKKPVIPASHHSKVSAVNAAKSAGPGKKDHH